MKKIYFVTNVLPKIHGGRTGSLLYRAKLLNSRGQNLTIISTNYNPNYPAVYQSFRDSKKVLHNTEFLNIYDYYKENSQTNDKILVWSEVLKEESEELSSLTQVIRSRKGGRSYYYKEGIPKYVIKESKQGIEFFAVYDEWNFNPSKYYFVNEEGLIHRIDYYDVENNLTRQEFLNNQGKIYLRKKFNLKNISEICLKKEEFISFSSEKEFIGHFFKEVFDENGVVVNDARFLDIPLLKTNVGKRIFQMHSSHLVDPLDNDSVIKGSFSNILNSIFPQSDTIVSLTVKQKKDILAKVPSLEKNIVVIPHSTMPRKIKHQRKTNHFGIVSRLSPEKNLEDAIKGFALFVMEYPNYILDIYGDGECRQELEDLVVKLNIKDKVIFHGYVVDTDKAYQEVQNSLVTSNYEGFSLVTLEAISNGTTVITYALNYGPTDIIDEHSGWVTSERTPEALKEKMIEAVKNPKNVEKVQQRSLEFSEEKFINKWLELLENN
ncbi:glycosyltransferase [Lactococcus sp. LG606]|uniref:glycosyltransferase n=1 Tax=Lactococcus sp. LG606 TaxID=2816912 RepID=UPI001A90C43D|nr:glycosyltransferase [Lactococcus sp. LG606]QSR13204.1 glycosyltransferase [Lactococcus sp. LG606]